MRRHPGFPITGPAQPLRRRPRIGPSPLAAGRCAGHGAGGVPLCRARAEVAFAAMTHGKPGRTQMRHSAVPRPARTRSPMLIPGFWDLEKRCFLEIPTCNAAECWRGVMRRRAGPFTQSLRNGRIAALGRQNASPLLRWIWGDRDGETGALPAGAEPSPDSCPEPLKTPCRSTERIGRIRGRLWKTRMRLRSRAALPPGHRGSPAAGV
jgi:hypothetical protein